MTDKQEIDWTDPDAIAAHLDLGEETETTDDGSDKKVAAEVDETKASAESADDDAASADKGEPEQTPQIDGVLTRDGKHVMPYSTVETARNEAADWKRRAEEAERQVEEFKARQAEIKADDSTTGAEQDEALKQLEDDYPPELLQILKTAQQEAREAKSRADKLEADRQAEVDARENQSRQDREDQIAADHAKAIEHTPLLQKLERRGGAMWKEAIAISDERLAEFKKAGKTESLADHYKAVEQELRDTYGLADPSATNKQGKPLPDGDTDPPSSLSTIPGGLPPATSESEAFEAMDPMRATATLAKMNPKQMDEFLSRNFG